MKQIFDSLKSYIKDLIIKTILKLSGLKAWVVGLVIKYLFKQVDYFLKKQEIKKEETKKGEEAKKDYEVIINDPDKSIEEKHKAIDDLFNR